MSIGTTSIWNDLLGNRDGRPRPYRAAVYHDYLQSDLWKKRRSDFLSRHPCCFKCGNRAWQVHHLTYANVGNEKDADLEALCGRCHHKEHHEPESLTPSPRS